jgi:ankyrin repeat protein
MHLAAIENKIDVLTVLLEQDQSLGYFISTTTDAAPLLCIAASQGNVGVARELLRHCPDPPYCDAAGSTCLHVAVSFGQADFVRFVVRSPQLEHLVNLPDNKGETALQLAARINDTNMVAVLRFHLNSSINAEPFTSVRMVYPYISVSVCIISADRAVRPQVMPDRLLEAAVCGHVAEMRHLYLNVPGVLVGTTPQGNTCLHIAAIHGHEVFCKEAQALKPPLLAAVNSDGETPLLAAVAGGRVSVASALLRCCRDRQLIGTIQKQDKTGSNVLHHAIRSGHRELALELIEAEPALSHAVNQYGESPMFIAVMRNCEDVVDKLLQIPDSAHGGAHGCNALHAAVKNRNSGVTNVFLFSFFTNKIKLM